MLVVASVMAGLLAVGSGVGIGWGLARTLNGADRAQRVPSFALPGVVTTVDNVAAKVEPAVVDVNTVIEHGSSEGQAAGTGMILTSNGEVLTNHHVVAGASSIKVVTHSGHRYSAHVVGVDIAHDVALVQLENASHLPTVKLASGSPSIGDQVIAIGNAFGQGGRPAVTEGRITALDRSITATDGQGTSEQLNGLIQMDAPISPGDSGGPLVNMSAEVVGMITAGDSGRFRQTTSEGYAVPAGDAKQSVAQIKNGNSSPTLIIGAAGYIGVQVESAARGVLVQGVVPGSPADKAGITANAVITAVNGQPVTSIDSLGALLHVHKPGEQVRVTWTDDAGTHTATLTLMSGPAI